MIAVCCAMNNNRSMETHSLFLKKNINIKSYGTSHNIKLPGLTPNTPNIYEYGTTYKEIYDDLVSQNKEAYDRIGLLYLLERNMKVKERPENFFDAMKEEIFTVVITCEEKCFESIYQNVKDGGSKLKNGFWLVNFEIKDTISDAVFGANDIYNFVRMIEKNDVESAIEKYSVQNNKEMLCTYIVY